MFKWFALFLILAGLVGYYWLVMSGTMADRNIDVQIRAALKEPGVPEVVTRLQAIQERIDTQERQVKQLAFIARNPDWSRLQQARDAVGRLLETGTKLARQTPEEGQSPALQTLQDGLRNLESITVETFYPQQRTFWSVLFWVLAVPTGLFALLSFIRAQPV